MNGVRLDPMTESTSMATWKLSVRVGESFTVVTVVPIEPPAPVGSDVGELLQDLWDIETARDAFADPDNQTLIPWPRVKKSLGL